MKAKKPAKPTTAKTKQTKRKPKVQDTPIAAPEVKPEVQQAPEVKIEVKPEIKVEVKPEVKKTELAVIPPAPPTFPKYVVHTEEIQAKYMRAAIRLFMVELEAGPKAVLYKYQKYTPGKPKELFLEWPRTLWTFGINTKNFTVFTYGMYVHAIEEAFEVKKLATALKRFPMPNISPEGSLCTYTTDFGRATNVEKSPELVMAGLLNSVWNEGRAGDYSSLGFKFPTNYDPYDTSEGTEQAKQLEKCVQDWHDRTKNEAGFIKNVSLATSHRFPTAKDLRDYVIASYGS